MTTSEHNKINYLKIQYNQLPENSGDQKQIKTEVNLREEMYWMRAALMWLCRPTGTPQSK